MGILSDAVELADTSATAATAATMVGRCHATGLAAASYRGLIAAAVTLGMTGSRSGVTAWRDDRQFVHAVVELEDELIDQATRIATMITRYNRSLIAAHASPPEQVGRADLIAALTAGLQVLIPTRRRISYAIFRLSTIPEELGEVYTAAYAHVRKGRALPYNGRFLTGEQVAPTSTSATSR